MRGDDSPVACFTGFDKLPSLHAQLVTNTRTFAHSHSGSVFSLHLSIELAVSVTHTHTHCQCVGFGWCRLLCWVRRKPSPKLNLSSCRCLWVCLCACPCMLASVKWFACGFTVCIQLLHPNFGFLWISLFQRCSNFHELLAVTGSLSETQPHTYLPLTHNVSFVQCQYEGLKTWILTVRIKQT